MKTEDKKITPNDSLQNNIEWEAELNSKLRRSTKTAWRFTWALIIIVGLLVIGFIVLLPLKQVVPHVVIVDKLTGEAQIAETQAEYLTDNQLNDKHWVKKFLVSRERYNYRLLQHDFNRVKRLTADQPWSDYSQLYFGKNPLDETLGENVIITPKVLSITLSEGGFATIRFELTRRDIRSTGEPKTQRLVATMRYDYEKKYNLSESEAIENPLGFTVLAYQVDSEFVGGN